MNKVLLIAMGAALLSQPLLSLAESGPAPTSPGPAAGRLDFRIRIPKILFLRVGSGAPANALAKNSYVNKLTYLVPAAAVGNGVPVTAVAASGDLGGGSVTVRVFANGGNSATLNSSTTGRMRSASAANTIDWTEILVASAALTTGTAGYSNGAIVHPTFNNSITGGAGSAVPLAGAGSMVRAEGQWTFSYANSVAVAAGTYGNSVARRGRVTYTASQP